MCPCCAAALYYCERFRNYRQYVGCLPNKTCLISVIQIGRCGRISFFEPCSYQIYCACIDVIVSALLHVYNYIHARFRSFKAYLRVGFRQGLYIFIIICVKSFVLVFCICFNQYLLPPVPCHTQRTQRTHSDTRCTPCAFTPCAPALRGQVLGIDLTSPLGCVCVCVCARARTSRTCP